MRPLEYLASLKGKNVIVLLKNGKQVTGTLEGSDVHLNLLLANAEFEGKKFEKLLVRGDMVLMVSEVSSQTQENQ